MNSVGQKAIQVIIEFESTKILSPILQLSTSTLDEILDHHFDVATNDFNTKNEMISHFLEFNYTYANEFGESLPWFPASVCKSNGIVTVAIIEFDTIEFTSTSVNSFSKQDKNLLRDNFNNFKIIAN